MKLNFIYRLQSRKFAIITIHLRLHKIQQFKATDWICHKAFGVTTFQRDLRLVEVEERKSSWFLQIICLDKDTLTASVSEVRILSRQRKAALSVNEFVNEIPLHSLRGKKNFQHMQTFYFLSFELHLIAHLYSYFGHDNIFRENWRDNTFKDNPNVCFYLHSVV